MALLKAEKNISEIERNILGLDLDSDPLTQTTQGVINGAGSHGHRILKIGNVRI